MNDTKLEGPRCVIFSIRLLDRFSSVL